jgi:hypothetical protein
VILPDIPRKDHLNVTIMTRELLVFRILLGRREKQIPRFARDDKVEFGSMGENKFRPEYRRSGTSSD